MWWHGRHLQRGRSRPKIAPRRPWPKRSIDPIPPGPRLQSAPPRDMDELRSQDQEALGYLRLGRQAGGVARIPIDRAMSIVLEEGVAPAPGKKEAK